MNEREEQLATQDVEARDEARMNDHLHEQQRGWSPGQAVAPCLTCQAGLCGEHGQARVETTTGDVVSCPACGMVVARTPAPAAEATGEMSAEGLRLALDPFYRQAIYAGMAEAVGNREMVNEHADRAEEALGSVLAAWSALRTRAREAEGRERDALRQRDNVMASFRAEKRDREIAQARNRLWDLTRDDCWAWEGGADASPEANHLDTLIAPVIIRPDVLLAIFRQRERDEAREQLAAANGRAEAYRKDRDLTAHRLAAAEAEVARLQLALNDSIDRYKTQVKQIAVAEAEVKRLQGEHPVRLGEINEAFTGTIPTRWSKDATGSVVQRVAALRERRRQLIAAGDEMIQALGADAYPSLLARWAAAKGEVTNG